MAASTSNRPIHAELQEVVAQLRQLQSVLAVAVGALHEQNADIDADIANLLRHSVGNPLHEQVARLEAILKRLPRTPARKR